MQHPAQIAKFTALNHDLFFTILHAAPLVTLCSSIIQRSAGCITMHHFPHPRTLPFLYFSLHHVRRCSTQPMLYRRSYRIPCRNSTPDCTISELDPVPTRCHIVLMLHSTLCSYNLAVFSAVNILHHRSGSLSILQPLAYLLCIFGFCDPPQSRVVRCFNVCGVFYSLSHNI